MNIKITHNWLLDYLETDATPEEIQKYLSLCGPSIEQVEKIQDDYVYDVEITTNRIDTASVFGIAQEAQAILPMFGKKAKLKENPLEKYRFKNLSNAEAIHELPLHVKITDPALCHRFTAIVLSNIEVKESPDFIKSRLQLSGIKSINNVVDISNYLMLALGQPTHIFDYDKIGKSTMIMRESKKGEKIITLDEKEIALPGGDIVIEDGDFKLIDLCGIMGGLNSSVTDKTRNILLFVQTYNKRKIRTASMLSGQRTVAAAYFEKGLDSERVEPTLVYGAELLRKYAEVKIASEIYDIYPHPYKSKKIEIKQEDINRIIGVKIDEKTIVAILAHLGFDVETKSNASLQFVITVPSFRSQDVNIKEDIVEEVARVYGYYKLPNNIQSSTYIPQPKEIKKYFSYQSKVKYFLKHLGINEILNYSMISKKQIEELGYNPKDHIRLTNTLSKDIEYLRKLLIPSLLKNVKDNTGKKEQLRFFELAKVYIPRANDLPDELINLGMCFNTDFFDLKGVVESLLKEYNIDDYEFRKSSDPFFSKLQVEIWVKNEFLGVIGEYEMEIILAELNFRTFLKYANEISVYKSLNPYAVIKLDWTVEAAPEKNYEQIRNQAFKISNLLQNLEVISIYKNKITIRFYFTSPHKNITEKEAMQELEKIKSAIN